MGFSELLVPGAGIGGSGVWEARRMQLVRKSYLNWYQDPFYDSRDVSQLSSGGLPGNWVQ